MTDAVFAATAARTAQPRAAGAAELALYVFTMFLGAGLIFLVQPMFAKMALPLLGGSAGVWNVALVFFQAALLAGYAYANALNRIGSLKIQIGVHLAMLGVCALALPIGVADGFTAPPAWLAPEVWLIGLFAASLGAPYAAVSATAPLLQAWFARSGHPASANPFQLYAASNLGSLLALLAYPLALEPFIGAAAQSGLWSLLYGLLAAAIGLCGLAALRAAPVGGVQRSAKVSVRIKPVEALRWMALAAIPSALLVATTNHIATDVASAPLLWVAPLALYLAAFSAAFAARPVLPLRAMLFAQAAFTAFAVAFLLPVAGWQIAVPTALGALFFSAYVCLRTLYEQRPDADHLTSFYVYVSIGGVIGGAFSALLAPALFESVWEYPLALLAGLLARPRPEARAIAPFALAGLGVAGMAAAVIANTVFDVDLTHGQVLLMIVSAAAGVLIAHRQRLAMILAAGAVVLLGRMATDEGLIHAERGFYGVVRVVDRPGSPYRQFIHGTTGHGAQAHDPAQRRTPLMYYGLETPIGDVFAEMNAAGRLRSVAVLGLGAGSTACYKKPGQRWVMVEIDPIVARIAQDRDYFTLLSDCAPDAEILIGDARLEMARQPKAAFDLIFADTFSSDSVPAHLLTREAVRLYLDRLAPGGVLAMHVSNRMLYLPEIVARVAQAEGAHVLYGDNRTAADAEDKDALIRNARSQIVLIARDPKALDAWRSRENWSEIAPPPGRPWTDDYSNIIEAVIAFQRQGKPTP